MIATVVAGRHRLIRKLGEGGMGEVYLAEQLNLCRLEAVKVLRPAIARQRDLVIRLRREARALERLRHENIVAFYDFGELPDGRVYLATEYVDGERLDAVVGSMPVSRVLTILRQLAEAIEHAHERGVIHRDIKPENLILARHEGTSDLVKVLDFGIAKILAPDHVESLSISSNGALFGTPEFMAPEQFDDAGQPEPRIDIYAAGCLGFALVAGKPPFSGSSMMELMHAHVMLPPEAPSRVCGRNDVPPELDDIILRCLAKPCEMRFQSGRELADAIDRIAPAAARRHVELVSDHGATQTELRPAPGALIEDDARGAGEMHPGTPINDRYRVVRLIGKGGMGAVYEVVNTRIERSFALKRLVAALAADSRALAGFKREAMIVASLRHPNIVDVVDWETLADGSPCIILEYLRGHDLGQRIASSGPLPWAALGRIARQILSALEVAHAAGIVHRDLKPRNVFLAQDDANCEHVKLLDFGLSRPSQTHATLSGDRLEGTPAYMSPEQADGRSTVGPEADVWAMGAILYEMATGRRAFGGASLPAILYNIVHGQAPSVDRLRPDAPPEFVDLVHRVLCRDGGRRLTQAAVLRAELNAALASVAPVQPDEASVATGAESSMIVASTEVETPGSDRRGRARAGWLAVALVVAGTAASLAVWFGDLLPGHVAPAEPAGASAPADPAAASAPATVREELPPGPPRPEAAPTAGQAAVTQPQASETPPATRPERKRRLRRSRKPPDSAPPPFGADQIFGQ